MFSTFSNKLKNAIHSLDPDRIYVENVRSILNVNSRLAKIVCNLAVKKGYFKRYYAVECKNDSCGRIIESFEEKEEIPSELHCYICKDDGLEKTSFKKEELKTIVFYQYQKGTYKVHNYI